jgi:hypothetical protein
MVGLLVMGFDPDSKGLSWVEGDRIGMGFLVDHSVYISLGQHFHFLSLQVVLLCFWRKKTKRQEM